jgi:DNA-directed RNA polymerase subunit alpha
MQSPWASLNDECGNPLHSIFPVVLLFAWAQVSLFIFLFFMTISTLREVTLLCNQRIRSDAWYSLVRISPFRKGQALTVASTLRRLLLQEIGAFGLTGVLIHAPSQPAHEFSMLSGIQESLPELTQNLRNIRFRFHTHDQLEQPLFDTSVPIRVTLSTQGRGHITAGDLILPPSVEVVHPTAPIATLVSPYAHLDFEAHLGYAKMYTSYIQESRARTHQSLWIPLEPAFSPVQRVNYVIKHADPYEFILFELWTDGSITPCAALAEASLAAKQLFQPFL